MVTSISLSPPPLWGSPPVMTMVVSLGLDSAYERKYVIFAFLSLAYLTQHNDLQFHLFSLNNKISFFLMAE
jgi:hypothetical protein